MRGRIHSKSYKLLQAHGLMRTPTSPDSHGWLKYLAAAIYNRSNSATLDIDLQETEI